MPRYGEVSCRIAHREVVGIVQLPVEEVVPYTGSVIIPTFIFRFFHEREHVDQPGVVAVTGANGPPIGDMTVPIECHTVGGMHFLP